MIEYEQLTGVFNKIIENPDDAKQALSDPSSVLIKHGLKVDDPEATNKLFFEVSPELRAHFLAAARGKPHENALLGCSSPGCIACKSGMAIALAALLPAVWVGGVLVGYIIVAIAELTGLPEKTVRDIIGNSPAGAHSQVISGLCSAMGAC